MSTSMIDNSVSKTAIDALYAKWSVVAAGYDPVCLKENNGKLYNNLTISMSEAFVNYKSSKDNKKSDGSSGLLPSSDRTEVRVKRQTPLVNAGYALRIQTVSSIISRFIQSHITTMNNPIMYGRDALTCHSLPGLENVSTYKTTDVLNVVMLGCGLDVLGLWALSLSPLQIRLFEIDCEEICDLKANVMVRAGILSNGNRASQSSNGNCIFIEECIDFEADSTTNRVYNSEQPDQLPNYTLLSTDLRNISDVKQAFKASSIDTTQRTIVISELVLPYLAQSNATELLTFIASDICCREGSMLLAYEPIGSPTNTAPVQNISVAQGYTTTYFQQFLNKLNSGHQYSTPSNGNEPHGGLFQPLAISCSHAQTKLRQCGFDGPVDCCQVPKAIQSCDDGHTINSPELFDEHAALQLHLQCYGVLCASSFGTNVSDFLKICPWTKLENAARDMGYWREKRIVASKGTEFIVSSIRYEDQEEVRGLFKDSYSGIFEEYPSVKKMVKTALKGDLNDKASGIIGGEHLSDSAIWNRYSNLGGAFWVVSEGRRSSTRSAKIIGCIGVTAYSNVDSIDMSKPRTYTIHRLVVDTAVRGQGIGNALLNTVEEYVMWRESNSPSTIIATTPAVMQAANQLYYSNGFDVQEEVKMGKMMIRTFHKTITKENRSICHGE